YTCEARLDGRRMQGMHDVCVPGRAESPDPIPADSEPVGGQTVEAVSSAPKKRPDGPALRQTFSIDRVDAAVRIRVEGHRRGVVMIVGDALPSASVSVPLTFTCVGATNCPGGTTCIDGECVMIPLEGECP
ncbi:MAG: hypothetical protein VX589_12975, partial [Myxococcota bacterium]|nr:hypothetical protein [Myxococcota bacterium]